MSKTFKIAAIRGLVMEIKNQLNLRITNSFGNKYDRDRCYVLSVGKTNCTCVQYIPELEYWLVKWFDYDGAALTSSPTAIKDSEFASANIISLILAHPLNR